MKKALIITITDYNNYGNQLQNYAMQEAIQKLNIDVTTLENNYIDQETTKIINSVPKITIKKIFQSVIVRTHNLITKILNKTLLKREYAEELKNIDKKIKKGQEFAKKYIIKNVNEQKKEDDFFNSFDYTIIGSDQIWNPYFMKSLHIDFAQFTDKNKKLSYAASLGVEKIPKELEKIYRDNVNQIKYVSVRENRGKEILSEVTNRDDIEVLIDPTMLITKEEWIKIEKKPEQLNEEKKYILNYFLGELSKERKAEIEKIAKENNCEIINILNKKDPFYTSGPSEFLYLERNAFLICTDSFHSCVFAILFNTPFIVFNREDKSVNMNSRIDTLLSKFNLQERYYKGNLDKKLLTANYEEAYSILEQERQKSFDFLKKSIEHRGE